LIDGAANFSISYPIEMGFRFNASFECRTDNIAISLVTADRMSVRPRCKRVHARHASRVWFRQFRSPQLRAVQPFSLSVLTLTKWQNRRRISRSVLPAGDMKQWRRWRWWKIQDSGKLSRNAA